VMSCSSILGRGGQMASSAGFRPVAATPHGLFSTSSTKILPSPIFAVLRGLRVNCLDQSGRPSAYATNQASSFTLGTKFTTIPAPPVNFGVPDWGTKPLISVTISRATPRFGQCFTQISSSLNGLIVAIMVSPIYPSSRWQVSPAVCLEQKTRPVALEGRGSSPLKSPLVRRCGLRNIGHPKEIA